MTPALTFTVPVSIDLTTLRPASPILCPDDQFDLFCTAFRQVVQNKQFDTPLHEAIGSAIARFNEEEELSLNELKKFLSFIAESAHRLSNNSLRSGKLVHVWNIAEYGLHPWVEEFSNLCNPSGEFEMFPEPSALMNKSPASRLNVLTEWGHLLGEIARSDQEYDLTAPDNEKKLFHEVETEARTFNRTVFLTCRKLFTETDFVRLTILDMDENKFQLTLEWDTSHNAPEIAFAIDQRIAEANRLDEASAATQNEVPENPYTLKIQTASAA